MGILSNGHRVMSSPTLSPSFGFVAIFENAIAGCLAIAVRDDHSKMLMLVLFVHGRSAKQLAGHYSWYLRSAFW
jgi:hypothetical protein